MLLIPPQVLEKTGQLQKAYKIYTDYLEELKSNLLPGEVEPERFRAASISLRTGHIAGRLDKRDDEESHKVWALEETLRMVAQFNGLERPGAGGIPPMNIRTVRLPAFIQRDQLGALVEDVGRMYTERGKAECVVDLSHPVHPSYRLSPSADTPCLSTFKRFPFCFRTVKHPSPQTRGVMRRRP